MAGHPASAGDGLLLVDKPAGVTSHDIVARVRRAQGTRRVGHAGTLDPFATGLLVCAVGHATRLLPWLQGEPKVYRARIAFGQATNTDDATGTVVAEGPMPDWSRWDVAIASLTGVLSQVPPAYSAKHVNGERAYTRARRGETVELPPVTITVHSWTRHEGSPEGATAVAVSGSAPASPLTELSPSVSAGWVDVTVSCSGGTYVRALARDLGVALGTVAHCATLRRLASGPLRVEDAVPGDQLVAGARQALRSPLEAMPHLPHLPITAELVAAIQQGRAVPAADAEGRHAVLVTGEPPRIVGVVERVPRQGAPWWQPRVVLPAPGASE